MNKIYRINDEVYIENSEDIYIVDGYKINEAYSYLTGKYIKETKYTLRSKKTGMIVEVNSDKIKAKRTKAFISKKIDELLDDYNVLMQFANIHNDNEFRVMAEGIMDKLERGDY